MISILLTMASLLVFASILQAKYLSPTEASKIIPGRPHKNTVRRWMSKGYDGVILPSFRIAGRRFTTQESVEEFVSTLMGKDSIGDQRPTSTAHVESENRLGELGV